MKSLNPKIMALAVILVFTAQLALAQKPCEQRRCRKPEDCSKFDDPYSPLSPSGLEKCPEDCIFSSKPIGICSNSRYEEKKPCAFIDCKSDRECLEYPDPYHPLGFNCVDKCNKIDPKTGLGKCTSGWQNTKPCKQINCTGDEECNRYRDPLSREEEPCKGCKVNPRTGKGKCFSPY